MPSFIFMTEFGEILDLALRLKDLGYGVLFHISDSHYGKVGDGMVEKVDDWFAELGMGHVWTFDGCSQGKLQDWLRERGEAVFGGSEASDELENDRQAGQDLFRAAGFRQPFSRNFASIDEALAFVRKNPDKRLILKQNGSAPKSINHMAKFEGNVDLVYHLEHLRKSWNETEYGKFDCDLMEVVEGTEMAASAFWNGHDWMRDDEGRVVGYLNFEEKKECDGGLGETTGEMGTTFVGVTGDDPLFADILLRPEIEDALRETGFRGVFDVNGTLTEDGEYVAFEPTCRFGVPATSYELLEGLETDPGLLLEAVAKGVDMPVSVHPGVGMVLVVAAKPFPVEAHLEDDSTSMGEKLWILAGDGNPRRDFTASQREHVHPYNFFHEEDESGEECYRVATESGYLLTVTGRDGDTVEEVRSNLVDYVRENLYVSGMKWRSDIGKRVEEFVSDNFGH